MPDGVRPTATALRIGASKPALAARLWQVSDNLAVTKYGHVYTVSAPETRFRSSNPK